MEFNGLLLIDKPTGPSSYDVIRQLKRNLFKTKVKIGHAGTLDPLAEGLLIILIGRATKKFDEIQKLPKEYLATIKFGRRTDTFDRSGKITWRYNREFSIDPIKLKKLIKKLNNKIINQTPPAFSALKVNGVRAYKLARSGQLVKIKARKASIYEAEIVKIGRKSAKIRFLVSSGTYIRSLADDIGKKLGYGGHLWSLKRTKIGSFYISDAKIPSRASLNDIIPT